MIRENVMRLNMLPRGAVRTYVPRAPAHWDLSKLNRKWYWRGLHWLLKKLGGSYRETVPASWPTQTVYIDHSDIVALLNTSSKAMRQLWDKEATTLILGYDEMEKLMKDAPTEIIRFDMRFPLARQEKSFDMYDTGYHLVTRDAHLRVILIPWLSGWALLPDLEK